MLPSVPPAPGPPPPLPERYQPGRFLGQGGMGRVYAARDLALGVDVAVKVIRPDLAGRSGVRERLLVEVRMAARIPHPNLVPLHDLGTLPDGTPFFAMALAEGGSLAGFRGEWAVCRDRIVDVLDALGALHARGVLHRDLKPENVLIHGAGAWVSDLGLAEVTDVLAQRGSDVSGTPEFMAPEQRAGRLRELGPSTDLYAVGRILDRLTVGMRVPEGFEALLAEFLHPDPYGRFERAADARRGLLALGPASEPRLLQAPRRHRSAPTLYPTPAPSEGNAELGPLAGTRQHSPGEQSPSERSTGGPIESTDTLLMDAVVPHPTRLAPDAGIAPPLPPRPPPAPLLVTPPAEAGRGTSARASMALLALREIPLVGRDEVRATLWELAREVVGRGAPRVAILVGEAGVGKTRLANSVAWALEEGGWMETIRFVYREPATPEDGSGGAARSLLRPWGESPESLEERLIRQFTADFGSASSLWAGRMRRWCGVTWLDEGPVDRSVALSLFWERMRRRAWRGGTCLLLDDAMWAEGSEGLSIARNLLDQALVDDPIPVLVLATLRADALDASPALSRQVEGLVEDGAVLLPIPRLDHEGTHALVHELLTLAPDVAEVLAARCEGNPLIARMLLCEWVDEGVLVDLGDLQHGFRPGEDPSAAAPDEAAQLFDRRVEAVIARAQDPEAMRTAIDALALAHGALPLAVHAAIAGPMADALASSGLFRREQDAWVWDHGLLLEAVRRRASARQDLPAQHRRVAEAWRGWGRSRGVDVDDQVGLHLVEAGEVREALVLLLPACRKAERTGRMTTLSRLATAAQRAADTLGPSACTRARQARYLRARALSVRGDLDAAEALIHEADNLPGGPLADTLRNERSEDTERLRGATITLPLETLDAAEPLTPDRVEGLDLAVEAYAAWVRGHLYRMRARLEEAAGAFEAARQLFRTLRDIEGLANAALQLAGCRRHAHAFEEAERLYLEALAAWRSIGNHRGEAYALRELGVLATWRGEGPRADELLAEARALFRLAGEAVGEGVAMTRQAQRALAERQLDVAEGLLRPAMHIFVANGALLEVQNCRNDLGEVARLRGDLNAARASYRAAVRWSEERGWREFTALGRVNLALVALTANDPLEALVEAERIVDALSRSRAHWLRPFAEAIRAAAHAQLGRPDETARRLRLGRKRGLGTHPDRDLAWVLGRVVEEAERRGWSDVAADARALTLQVNVAGSA